MKPLDRNSLIKYWTIKLYEEFADINRIYRLKLREVLIIIDDLNHIWGEWNPQLRTIRISEKLIKEYCWDTVIEVFKHEIAHQVVSETYLSQEIHGPLFKKICTNLGIAPWAAQAGGELPKIIPRWNDSTANDDESRLMKKIEKLLALAESPSEHEAALAMKRVRELYAKYNLEKILHKKASHNVYCVISRKKHRIDSIESMIFSIIVEFFNVRTIYRYQFDAKDCDEYRAVELIGTKENVMIAEYVYHFLWNKTQELCSTFTKTSKKKGRNIHLSYKLGVLNGFREKLLHDAPKNPTIPDSPICDLTNVNALINAQKEQLAEYVEHRYPNLTSSFSKASAAGDTSSFYAGKEAGSKIVIHRGLTHQKSEQGGYLT